MKPLAIPPAVAASDARSPEPSSLTGRLNTMSDEDVGLVQRRSAGELELRRPRDAGDVHARFDAGVRNLPRRRDVEQRIDLRFPREPDGAAADQVEAAALELVGPAHRIDRAQKNDRAVGLLGDVDVAARP